MFEEINAQMAAVAMPVQIWMNWMMLIFIGSVFFVKNHVEARWALATFPATMIAAFGIFYIWHNVHLFGIAHFLFWLPLFIYLLKRLKSRQHPKYSKMGPFMIWSRLIMATVLVSLIFDSRDICLVAMGLKH